MHLTLTGMSMCPFVLKSRGTQCREVLNLPLSYECALRIDGGGGAIVPGLCRVVALRGGV